MLEYPPLCVGGGGGGGLSRSGCVCESEAIPDLRLEGDPGVITISTDGARPFLLAIVHCVQERAHM